MPFCNVSERVSMKSITHFNPSSKNRAGANKYCIRYFFISFLSPVVEISPCSNSRWEPANDNIFDEYSCRVFPMSSASNFEFLDNNGIYEGREREGHPLFRTMHPAYINNLGTFFHRYLPGHGLFSLSEPLKISRNFPGANLESLIFFSPPFK